MVDDEARPAGRSASGRPARGRASWTGTHRLGAPRIDTSRVAPARDRPPPEPEDDHAWLDREAGPVVRPYTLTGGRARPITGGLGLLTYVEALYAPEADLVNLQPEHRAILSLTRTALSVAEIAARIDLPVGVVRVLVGDLLQASLVSTFESDATTHPPDEDTLQAVIDGLRAL
jgi:DNA-directed RNA polymerase specialized sigma24 family protein